MDRGRLNIVGIFWIIAVILKSGLEHGWLKFDWKVIKLNLLIRNVIRPLEPQIITKFYGDINKLAQNHESGYENNQKIFDDYKFQHLKNFKQTLKYIFPSPNKLIF